MLKLYALFRVYCYNTGSQLAQVQGISSEPPNKLFDTIISVYAFHSATLELLKTLKIIILLLALDHLCTQDCRNVWG